MRWTVGTKLAAGFAAIVAVVLALAGIQAYEMTRVSTEVDALHRESVVATEALGEARALLQRIRGRTFYHVASADPDEKRQIQLSIQDLEAEMFEALDTARAQYPAGDPHIAAIDQVRRLYTQFQQRRDDEVYPLSLRGDTAGALDRMVATTGPAFSAAADSLRALINQHVDSNRVAHDDLLAAIRVTNSVMFAASLLITLLAIAVAWILSRNISNRLRHLTTVSAEVTRGDYDKRARISGADEIAELATAFNEMTASLGRSLEEQRQITAEQSASREEIVTTVTEYGKFVERVAAGDLTARLHVNGHSGELSTLGNNLDSMGGALRTMSTRINEAVGSLASASAEILATIQQHGASANESATAVAETVATVDEVTQSAQRVAEQADNVASASQQSVNVSNAGSAAVNDTVTAMADVRKQMDAIASRIMALSEQAQAVSRIIQTVNELAEQSNLLALNASIEAARAGDEGRGFGVVAQEIRVLADQSREATSEVRSILGDIQKSTGEAVLATEQGTSAVARAVSAAQGAGERIEELAQTIAESSGAAQRILQSSQQQVQAVGQIAQAMHSISDASRQTVDGTRHVERAARDLNDLSDELRGTVGQYRI